MPNDSRPGDDFDPVVFARKIYTGLALVLAIFSVYAGMLGWRTIQIVLATAATIAVVGLVRARRDPRPPPPPHEVRSENPDIH